MKEKILFKDKDNIFEFNAERYEATRGLIMKNLEDVFSFLKGSPLSNLEVLADKYRDKYEETALRDVIEFFHCIEVFW